MTKEQIIALDCKKHIKIYKLNQLGLSNKEVADALGTNSGHVRNELLIYAQKPERIEKANQTAA